MEQKIPTVHDLYPHLTNEECVIVEETFDRYLLLVLEIFEDLEAEAEHTGQPLDELIRRGKLEAFKGPGVPQG